MVGRALSVARMDGPIDLVVGHFVETEKTVGGSSHLYQPTIRVEAGQFDETRELELVVRVADGVEVLSLGGTRSLVLDEAASDFAIADVDAA